MFCLDIEKVRLTQKFSNTQHYKLLRALNQNLSKNLKRAFKPKKLGLNAIFLELLRFRIRVKRY